MGAGAVFFGEGSRCPLCRMSSTSRPLPMSCPPGPGAGGRLVRSMALGSGVLGTRRKGATPSSDGRTRISPPTLWTPWSTTSFVGAQVGSCPQDRPPHPQASGSSGGSVTGPPEGAETAPVLQALACVQRALTSLLQCHTRGGRCHRGRPGLGVATVYVSPSSLHVSRESSGSPSS